MDIREAIKKAGPGGKIRRTCWKMELCWSLGDYIGIEDKEEPDRGLEIFTSNLTATDWEVIKEQTIEVNDVIQNCMCTMHLSKNRDCTVIGKSELFVALHRDGHGTCVCKAHKNKITLIRKGSKKHVFEGVNIIQHCDTNPHTYYPAQGEYPWDRQMLQDFHSPGKTYRMTLEEME